jgi:hypothetical protein
MHGRKPVHLERRGGKSPRQLLWEVIRAQRSGFTCCSLSRDAKVCYETVVTYVGALRIAGYLSLLDEREPISNERRMALLRDNGVEAPSLNHDGSPSRKGLSREAMWRTLHILGETTVAELAGLASAAAPTSLNNARCYLSWLVKAGYVQVAKGGRAPRYRLVPGRYSGPQAPMVQKIGQVYDANLGKVVWSAAPEEESA